MFIFCEMVSLGLKEDNEPNIVKIRLTKSSDQSAKNVHYCEKQDK